MNDFEKLWRTKVAQYTEQEQDKNCRNVVENIVESDPVKYTYKLVSALRNETSEEVVKRIFTCSACHLPHVKLKNAKIKYDSTHSIEETRLVLEKDFKKDIKLYKNLSDQQVEDIINRGWGLAGLYNDGKIIATKIPAMFHEYFNENDVTKKKYYYCHCPRVRKELLINNNFDSIYCNCGGGFYKDVWEYITGKKVNIDVVKTLFDNNDYCQFIVNFTE